jgi:acyl-coenzyme A thioesterase PaaI-like protein
VSGTDPSGTDPSRTDQIRDVADAVRALIHRMVATEAPAEVFAGIADELRTVAARLEPYPRQHLFMGLRESALGDAAEVGDDYEGAFDLSPLMGRANPLAPPLRLEIHDDRVVGTATFDSAYEGPPGCVHGGLVAAAFDELLGLAQMHAGQPGMTARLVINYRSPTPLHEELRLEGRVARVEGRKTFCTGEIHVGDRLCAEAEALFVALEPGRFAAMVEQLDR